MGWITIETKITEKFEFLTDVIKSYNGSEQRIKLRQEPRHFISYDYLATNASDAQWIRSMTRFKQNGVIHIPMWQNTTTLRDDGYKGSKAVYINKQDIFNFRYCDAVMFFYKDGVKLENEVYLIKEILANGTIGLKNSLEMDISKKSIKIIPLIRCAIQPIQGLNYQYSNGSIVTLNYEDILYKPIVNYPVEFLVNYDNHEFFNPYKVPLTYNGLDVLFEVPSWSGDDAVALAVEKNATKLDNSTGKFKYDLKSNLAQDLHSYNFLLLNKESINNFIKFYHKCNGRQKPFYMPSYVNDIQVTSDLLVGTNYIYVDVPTLYKYYGADTTKKKIIIFLNGSVLFFDIVAYTYEVKDNKQVGKILLGQTIPYTITQKQLQMISYFNLCRFDSDTLQVNYETCEVASVDIPIREVLI